MVRLIDDIDHAIIACLQHDSRTPSAEIARRVGVAERTVRARIDRLVQDGVVRLVALVSPEALGYTVTADVFLEVEIGRVQEVAELVSRVPGSDVRRAHDRRPGHQPATLRAFGRLTLLDRDRATQSNSGRASRAHIRHSAYHQVDRELVDPGAAAGRRHGKARKRRR